MTGILLVGGFVTAITNLKGVLLTLWAAIGAVMLVYGGIKFAMAFLIKIYLLTKRRLEHILKIRR